MEKSIKDELPSIERNSITNEKLINLMRMKEVVLGDERIDILSYVVESQIKIDINNLSGGSSCGSCGGGSCGNCGQ